MKKVPARRNPVAKALAQVALRPRVVRNKKKYSRKGNSRRVAPVRLLWAMQTKGA